MKMTQTWGWLAAGVLAAGLNASYHDGGLEWAHHVADRVVQTASMMHDLASGRADLFLTEARLFLSHDKDSSSPLVATLARVQSRIAPAQRECARAEARPEVMTARQQAALARAEAQRDRIEAIRERAEARVEAEHDRFEARVAELRMPANLASVAFRMPQPPCPRVRTRLPRMPRMTMPAAPIHIAIPSTDPI